MITVASGGMYTQRLDVRMLDVPAVPFDGVRVYANAKRAEVVLNELWSRHPAGRGIHFHAMHPGWADTPGVQTSLPRFRRVMRPLLRSAEQGADTTAWLAGAPEALESNGAFWLDRRPRSTTVFPWTRTSDAEAERLWNWCTARAGARVERGARVVRIAIVGTGVSGLVAAHQLHPHHDLTVFEADARVGGHANTVDVEIDGVTHGVDTGFIVYNDANYPGFASLLRELGVATQPTEMSFSVADARTGLEYRGSNLNTLFAQRRNLVRPSFLRLLADIVRFNRAARRLVADVPRWQGADRLPAAADPDGRRVRVDRIVHRAGPLLPRVRGAVPRAVRRRDLVGGPGDVHAVPDAFVRPLHAQPRAARRAGPDAVAHGHRRFAPLRRRADRAVRRSHPARDSGAQDRRGRTRAAIPPSRS